MDALLHDPRFVWTIAGLISVFAILLYVVWRKGRPFASGTVFRASRLSSGNHLFPTQVLISPTSVVHYTPQWFGRLEHSIHMAHVASVRIDNPPPAVWRDGGAITPRKTRGTELVSDDFPVFHWRHDARFS